MPGPICEPASGFALGWCFGHPGQQQIQRRFTSYTGCMYSSAMDVLTRPAPGPCIFWLSDTHLGFDYPLRRPPTLTDRGPDFFANFEHVLDQALAQGADALLHTGDVFFRSRVHPSIVDRAYAALLRVADVMPVILLPGNHERSALPPSLFFNHPNLHIFDTPRTFVIRLGDMNVAFTGMPFTRKVQPAFATHLRAAAPVTNADARYLCLHQSIEGAVVGPSEYHLSASDPEVIPTSLVPTGFDGVLVGHIHRHQVLAAPSPVIFCGSTERTSFAEADETKGYCKLFPATGTCNFTPLPARPMVTYPHNTESEPFAAWVRCQPDRAIVRFSPVDAVAWQQARARLHPGMILQWSRKKGGRGISLRRQQPRNGDPVQQPG